MLTSVAVEMQPQVVLVAELLGARGTREHPDAAVCAHVRVQVGGSETSRLLVKNLDNGIFIA